MLIGLNLKPSIKLTLANVVEVLEVNFCCLDCESGIFFLSLSLFFYVAFVLIQFVNVLNPNCESVTGGCD